MYYAYILKSLKDHKYYYGCTGDIVKRIAKHNKGDVQSTKHRRPLVLHYHEEFDLIREAYKRERYFKSIDGYLWLKNNNII